MWSEFTVLGLRSRLQTHFMGVLRISYLRVNDVVNRNSRKGERPENPKETEQKNGSNQNVKQRWETGTKDKQYLSPLAHRRVRRDDDLRKVRNENIKFILHSFQKERKVYEVYRTPPNLSEKLTSQ